MNTLKINICIVFFFGVVFLINAQQDSQYTQYMYNTSSINPAYAGSRNALSFNALYRTQWVGLEGAPKTVQFSTHSPIGKQKKWGLGVNFFNDKIGPTSESNITIDGSYAINLSEYTKLAFGLKLGANFLNLDANKLTPETATTINSDINSFNRISPTLGAGVYMYQSKWYVGISFNNVIESNHFVDVPNSTASELMNLYGIMGYVFEASPNLKIKPAVLGKIIEGAPVAIDVSLNLLFNEKFTLGAAYRLDAAFSFLAGFQVNNRMFLGYAYDVETTELSNYNSGSHEFFLRYEIRTEIGKHKIYSPRFF